MATGRPIGAGFTTFGDAAARLLDNGYAPLPIRPCQKAPAPKRWSAVAIEDSRIDQWVRRYPDHGVGLRTGPLVGLDIDLLDADLAHQIHRKAEMRLGATLLRIGNWPKRLLLYRTEEPFRKLQIPGVEVLGAGQQFVAFGIHPKTGKAYSWPLGETPLEVAFTDLPTVTPEAVAGFLGEISPFLPSTPVQRTSNRSHGAPASVRPQRDESGKVVDGRDAWLSSIAFHAVHDMLDSGAAPNIETLGAGVWDCFVATTDLTRPRKGGLIRYRPADAVRKVTDKLRLHRQGDLPPRRIDPVEADYTAPTLTVEAARERLDASLSAACAQILAWHQPDPVGPCPQIGIRATVGLGKSVAARQHLLHLRAQLQAQRAPDRILVFTPSHALAEETAANWRSPELKVAVLRGYEAQHPVQRVPMCRDIEAVRTALRSGLDVQSTVCQDAGGRHCRHITTCPKQQNRRELAAADVIVAPYDALFSGFAIDPAGIAVLLIDESCWARAVREYRGLWCETLSSQSLGSRGGPGSRARTISGMADLDAMRAKASRALAAAGPGYLCQKHLLGAGLTAEGCRHAARLERARRRDPGLVPGMTKDARQAALGIVGENEVADRLARLWTQMADLLCGREETNGRIRVLDRDRNTGLHEIVVTELAQIHQNLRGKPVLHLDATLRPEIARCLLPDLTVTAIEAAAPHMSVRLVAGRFGKSNLCSDPRQSAAEIARRRNRLEEVVNYVRWQAARNTRGPTLVVTYKSCKAAFADIPGVKVAHFNAIAGLDRYREVAQLIVVGRPLPGHHDLEPIAGAVFRSQVRGCYRSDLAAVRLASGESRAVRAIRHQDVRAEALRAAICDDELVQAIGRGRGVNRCPGNPLEVHILADVALPLIHERVTSWDMDAPDLIQRMVLAGLAVDSPADAVQLHPDLFGSEKQAQKAFERAGFKRQNPIGNSYREMSLKSASYRRPGRGRSWQTAWWIDGSEKDARLRLEAAVAPLAEWVPVG